MKRTKSTGARKCGICNKTGHNSRTCPNTSKQKGKKSKQPIRCVDKKTTSQSKIISKITTALTTAFNKEFCKWFGTSNINYKDNKVWRAAGLENFTKKKDWENKDPSTYWRIISNKLTTDAKKRTKGSLNESDAELDASSDDGSNDSGNSDDGSSDSGNSDDESRDSGDSDDGSSDSGYSDDGSSDSGSYYSDSEEGSNSGG